MDNANTSAETGEFTPEDLKRREREHAIAEGLVVTFVNDRGATMYLSPPRIIDEFVASTFAQEAFEGVPHHQHIQPAQILLNDAEGGAEK